MTEMTQPYDAPDPWMAQWWAAHLADAPLVVVRCTQCSKDKDAAPIGEIKRDGDTVMALRRMVRPESTVPRPRIGAPNAAVLREQIEEREQHVLKHLETDAGPMEVMKQHRDLRPVVGPLDWAPSFFCPTHGELKIDHARLTKFVADTQGPNRTYRT